jgi:hypothetical protein
MPSPMKSITAGGPAGAESESGAESGAESRESGEDSGDESAGESSPGESWAIPLGSEPSFPTQASATNCHMRPVYGARCDC